MLSDTQIKAFKPRPKPYKKSDGDGLFLIVRPDGAKWWRQKYHLRGVEKMLSVGVYPDVPLALARAKRLEIRQQLAAGIDPSAARKAARAADANTFAAIAAEWLTKRAAEVSAQTVDTDRARLERWVFPSVGNTPIAVLDDDAPAMLAMLKRIETRGKLETASRIGQTCSQVFRYAIATGRATRDPMQDLRGALKTPTEKNLAAVVEPRAVGELLRAVWAYTGAPLTEIAMKLSAYVFVRPGELRGAEWSEIDLDAAEWRIPGERMKRGRPHIVPLATQAVTLLKDAALYSSGGKFVFPTSSDPKRCMSENTIRAGLARLGYDGENGNPEHTAHGWRSTASTLLNEAGFNADLIELQLAHQSENDVRRAYNRALRLDERRAMMQAYADKLDALRATVRR
jgi:integrase